MKNKDLLKRVIVLLENDYHNYSVAHSHKIKATLKELIRKSIIQNKQVMDILIQYGVYDFEDFYVETDVPLYIDVLNKHIETLED